MVTLDVSIPSLNGKKVTIHRVVKTAANPVITPADPDVIAALEAVQLHPEFVLSRRELIRYVISKPGDRARAVQAQIGRGACRGGVWQYVWISVVAVTSQTNKEMREETKKQHE